MLFLCRAPRTAERGALLPFTAATRWFPITPHDRIPATPPAPKPTWKPRHAPGGMDLGDPGCGAPPPGGIPRLAVPAASGEGFRRVVSPPGVLAPYYDRIGFRREGDVYVLEV